MLPRLDGFAICDAIRHHSREQPLIILTAKTTDEDIITGLTLGADDYVAKPFSVRELVLRVEAVLRRSVNAGMRQPNCASARTCRLIPERSWAHSRTIPNPPLYPA